MAGRFDAEEHRRRTSVQGVHWLKPSGTYERKFVKLRNRGKNGSPSAVASFLRNLTYRVGPRHARLTEADLR
jgi:hypothetical protein